jgi:hypothetical protein
MPKLFSTDFCRSGMCVWQQLGMALLIADELSNEQNHIAEKRRVQELKNEARRLMEEEEIHHDIGIKT